MGRTRAVYFDIDDIQKVVDFGTYALMMYYAKQINFGKAKKLFDATLTEYGFRVEYEIPTGSLDGVDDLGAHFIRAEIIEAIAFIDNELIPALNEEPQDLLIKYGGRENFLELYYTNPDYLIALGLNDNEFYFDIPNSIAAFLERLKGVFEYALSVNRAYDVYVH